MQREEKDVAIAIKDVLRAIAVVYVPVEDGDAFGAVRALCGSGSAPAERGASVVPRQSMHGGANSSGPRGEVWRCVFKKVVILKK